MAGDLLSALAGVTVGGAVGFGFTYLRDYLKERKEKKNLLSSLKSECEYNLGCIDRLSNGRFGRGDIINLLRTRAYEMFLDKSALFDESFHKDVMDTYGHVESLNNTISTHNAYVPSLVIPERHPTGDPIQHAAEELKPKLEELIKKLDEHIQKMDC